MAKDIRARIDEFSKTIPDVLCVKAYGSSIGYQEGYKENEKKQIDLIVVVDNIKDFYRKNMDSNPYMYNFIPKVYFTLANEKSLRKHASICYTTHIKYKDDIYKMGVIEKKDVIDDLLNWRTFYIAGRFQKEMYTSVYDDEIEKANVHNRKNALLISLLLLDKEAPNLGDLYETLCSLSYKGDTRKMVKAEDPNKVKKLAKGSKNYFNSVCKDNTDLFKVVDNEKLIIDYKKVYESISELPYVLSNVIKDIIERNLDKRKERELIKTAINEYLEKIIKSSSLGQTTKGILTTGPVNSISYAVEKFKKGRKK